MTTSLIPNGRTKCYAEDEEGNPIVDEVAVSDTLANIRRIFPLFRATPPPDLTFFGFPFSEEEAIGNGANRGKFLVFEERVSEARFGLDSPADDAPQDWENMNWDNLSWSHFGFGTNGNEQTDNQEGDQGESQADNQHYGAYLDNPPKPVPRNANGMVWQYASSAKRASITLQKPVRIAVHARQLIPEDIRS